MGFDDDDDEDEARTLPALVLPLLRSGAAAAAAGGGGRIVVKPGLIIGVNIFLFRLFFPPLLFVCVVSLVLKQNFFSREKISLLSDFFSSA